MNKLDQIIQKQSEYNLNLSKKSNNLFKQCEEMMDDGIGMTKDNLEQINRIQDQTNSKLNDQMNQTHKSLSQQITRDHSQLYSNIQGNENLDKIQQQLIKNQVKVDYSKSAPGQQGNENEVTATIVVGIFGQQVDGQLIDETMLEFFPPIQQEHEQQEVVPEDIFLEIPEIPSFKNNRIKPQLISLSKDKNERTQVYHQLVFKDKGGCQFVNYNQRINGKYQQKRLMLDINPKIVLQTSDFYIFGSVFEIQKYDLNNQRKSRNIIKLGDLLTKMILLGDDYLLCSLTDCKMELISIKQESILNKIQLPDANSVQDLSQISSNGDDICFAIGLNCTGLNKTYSLIIMSLKKSNEELAISNVPNQSYFLGKSINALATINESLLLLCIFQELHLKLFDRISGQTLREIKNYATDYNYCYYELIGNG
ncbi:UNKNOWN [Stylonychia lemnae]|uniref:Uncharacterized protein n=1 Tax=Stylonychia lemnae TaxID=5949 RepID=A0A078AW06_STYLE|nr:UNKNOWN [Stylonychia lemnae]|eukprot:CDW84963.1 UNKNOWN [Stylonychia lemnae]